MSNEPEIESAYADDFKRFNVGGIFGGVYAGGIRATLFSEHNDFQKVLEKQTTSWLTL